MADWEVKRIEDLKGVIEKLRPLHTKLGKPQPGDWLESRYEPGQTFEEYINCHPVTPHDKRRVIYILPLGEFSNSQYKIITLTAESMGYYFNLPVKIMDKIPLSVIPQSACRTHPEWGMSQILSTYVLDKLLLPNLPDDAAVYIALTSSDLWPGPGWNFVFGQASIRERVGVWSIYRNGNPDEGEKHFRLCLLRTMKTATHETGHIFSMLHCIIYECNMCGSNNREESDRRPIALCPECMAKLCLATGTDPLERYKKLSFFCKKNGLLAEHKFYEKCIKILQ